MQEKQIHIHILVVIIVKNYKLYYILIKKLGSIGTTDQLRYLEKRSLSFGELYFFFWCSVRVGRFLKYIVLFLLYREHINLTYF